MKTLFIAATATIALALSASAIPLGHNITIPDLVGSGSGWHGAQEDQEVEPGSEIGQHWDQEAFFLLGNTLTMATGYDARDRGGDIFVDITGDAAYGPSNDGTGYNNSIVNNAFGYDYVLDMNYQAMTYNVFALNTPNVTTITSDEQINQESNPWLYDDGGTPLLSLQNVPFQFLSGLDDADVGGLQGGDGSHFAIAVDLGFLGSEQEFTVHNTMYCGNDNLMGRAYLPDGGNTVMLLSATLLGMAFMRPRRKIKV